MASERQITLIKRILFLLLFLAIAAGVWFYEPKKKAPEEIIAKEKKAELPFERAPVKTSDEMPGEGKGVMTTHSQFPESASAEDFDKLLKTVASPNKGVAIVHCHLPGDPASEQLADTFNSIQKKYGKLVSVIRVGFPAQPADWQAQKGIRLPYVMMIVGTENAFQFQGLWPLPKVEKKVEELISGVRRVGKDWRPIVPGMSPKNH
jgi:hypothetical protein